MQFVERCINFCCICLPIPKASGVGFTKMSNGLLAINVAAAHTLDKNMVEANFASNRASKTPLHLLHFIPSLCSGICVLIIFLIKLIFALSLRFPIMKLLLSIHLTCIG